MQILKLKRADSRSISEKKAQTNKFFKWFKCLFKVSFK
jgi:hypothetical protein